MKVITRQAAVAAMALCVTLAFAREARPAERQGVWKFVDANTFGVARMDLAAYDRGAFEKWFADIISTNTDAKTAEAVLKDVHEGPGLALPEKLKQAGAKEMFGVLTLSDIPNTIGWIVIPVPAGGNAEGIARAFFESVGAKADAAAAGEAGKPLLKAGSMFAVAVGDSVIISAGATDRFEHFVAADRPDLAKAFAAAGEASVVGALSPTDDTRKVVEQMMPQLPRPASVPSTVVTRGLRSAYAAVGLPPQAKVNLAIQSDGAEAAGELNALIGKLLGIARNDQGFRKAVPGADQVIDAVTPKVEGDRLTVALDSAGVDKVVGLFATGIVRARQQAATAQSMSNERQLLLAMTMYANDHKGAFPDDFKAMASYVGGEEGLKRLTTSPQFPERKPGYVYIKPTGDLHQARAETMVLHEAFDKWPGRLGVGFVDGHCEMVSSEDHFKKLLDAAKKPPAEK